MKSSTLTAIKPTYALYALNFFMADLVAGIGPFLGIFLLAKGWQSGWIGTVMTIGGVAGMAMTAPAGALMDSSRHKRAYVIISALCTVAASIAVIFSQNFWVVSLSQIGTAIGGAQIGTAVIGITLGIVRQKGFDRQNGYNQAFNHAGNVAGAALSGYLGLQYGMTAIFLLSALFGLLAVVSTLLIPPSAIDDNAARGLGDVTGGEAKVSGLKVLLTCKPLLILSTALACFHLGNGALLPLYGMAAATSDHAHAAEFVAMTIIIAQLTMVVASVAAMKVCQKKGYWLVMLVSFAALPVRGWIAAHIPGSTGIYPVQILDGLGAGLQSVAVPGLVAHILAGSGRVNVGQGVVMTVQGIGAALSPAIGGWIAQSFGYDHAFMILGSFALVSIVLWVLNARQVSNACAKSI